MVTLVPNSYSCYSKWGWLVRPCSPRRSNPRRPRMLDLDSRRPDTHFLVTSERCYLQATPAEPLYQSSCLGECSSASGWFRRLVLDYYDGDRRIKEYLPNLPANYETIIYIRAKNYHKPLFYWRCRMNLGKQGGPTVMLEEYWNTIFFLPNSFLILRVPTVMQGSGCGDPSEARVSNVPKSRSSDALPALEILFNPSRTQSNLLLQFQK